MSLIKALTNKKQLRKKEDVKQDFITVLESSILDVENIQPLHLAHLVSYYSEYAAIYLAYVATTLEEPKGVNETMKFMNSYIVEIANKAGLHYYDKEQGFSIIDKAVQKALDNGGRVSNLDVLNIIDKIEESYTEEDDEE